MRIAKISHATHVIFMLKQSSRTKNLRAVPRDRWLIRLCQKLEYNSPLVSISFNNMLEY